MKTILGLTFLTLLIVFTHHGIATEPKPEQVGLPPGWKLSEIEKATPPYGVEGKLDVLAWQIREDDRPLRVECCLVLKVLPEERKEGRWYLAQLYRHPHLDDAKWQLGIVHAHGPAERPFPGRDIHHIKRFKERPNNKAVYDSLGFEGVHWQFELEEGWSYVGCSVCEEVWQAALGEKPTRFFGAAKK